MCAYGHATRWESQWDYWWDSCYYKEQLVTEFFSPTNDNTNKLLVVKMFRLVWTDAGESEIYDWPYLGNY